MNRHDTKFLLYTGWVPSIQEKLGVVSVQVSMSMFRNFRTRWQVFRITAFCMLWCMFGESSNLCRFFPNECGVTPVGDIINGRIVTFSCCHICFNSIARGEYLSIFSLSFICMLSSLGMEMSIRYVVFSFLLISVISGLLCATVLSVCSVLSQYNLMFSFSSIVSG